ncbi:hypothetical protein EV127DRAFT_31142 [Xylaria flabelliformis]|nr:hypothetical protein EV127DRAFT_31142 [Xylaria flabelliformis]
MPHNTRSRQQRLQPVPPLSCRQTRRRKALRSSAQESPNKSQHVLTQEPNHASAMFSLSESSLEELSENVPRPSSTPTPIGPCRTSIPQRRKSQVENPADDPPLDLGSESAPTAPQEPEYMPGHVEIVHFDFNKYRPRTPGSKSAPIKIEDSPKSSSSSSADTNKCQEPLALPVSLPKETAIRYDYHSCDASQVEHDHVNGSSFMTLSGDPVLSEGVKAIITSPKAATTYLHCFLASEKYWLKSLDHDMDPDEKFWKNIIKRYNACPHGYSISTWLTARIIATTLCSQPYKAQLRQQLPKLDSELVPLISAIEDCRRMSQRRRREQRSCFENSKTRISGGMATRQNAQKGVLGRKPQTLEDQKMLLQTLATVCAGAESARATGPSIDKRKARPKPDSQNSRKGVCAQPHPADLLSSNNHNILRNNLHASGVTRRNNPNKRFKTSGKRGNQLLETHHPYPLIGGEGRRNWQGISSSSSSSSSSPSSSSRCTAPQDRDKKHCLEQRVRELERTIKGLSKTASA